MEVKDQLKISMDKLGINAPELGKRVGVSAQSVRFWLTGRSWPGKAKVPLIERELECKLDFSDVGNNAPTVEDSLGQTDIETFLAISKMPPTLKQMFNKLVKEIVLINAGHTPVSEQPVVRPVVNSRGYIVKPDDKA